MIQLDPRVPARQSPTRLSLIEGRAPADAAPAPGADWRPAPHNPLLHLPQPLWLLRGDGRPLLANPAAQALQQGWLSSDRQRLVRVGSLGSVQLGALLRLAAAGTPAQAPLWLTPALATGRLLLQALAPALRLAWAAPADTVLASLLLDDAAAQQHARLDALCGCCRLTPAERCVLLLLADGLTPEAAAAHLDVRLSTLRSHVRHLLAKTGTGSLLQLLRWVGSAAAGPGR